MSMEVSRNYSDYKKDYPERLQENMDQTKEVGNAQDAVNKSERIQVPTDEYINSEQSDNRPSGLYHMGTDENGNPKVLYDDPKKAKPPKAKSGSRENDTEEVTGNTDAVDREIEKLKKQKQQLEQQIASASEDEEKTRELEKKLAQVESELSQKNTDTYRRAHAVVTSRA